MLTNSLSYRAHVSPSQTFVLQLVAACLLTVAWNLGPSVCLVDGQDATNATSESKTPASQEWKLFRGDTRSTGVAHTTLPKTPTLIWKHRIEGGAFESTAAVADGVVYIGDLDGHVFALSLADGTQRWKTELETGFIAPAAFREGRIYLGDIDGVFHCFEAKSGKELWKVEAEAEIDSCANFYKEYVIFGSQDATLYCVDAKSGKLVWKHTIEDQIRCSPTLIDNLCFVAGCDGRLHVINVDTGKKASDVEIMSPTGSTPAAEGHFVYFGTEGGEVLCIDWKASKVAWRFQTRRNASFRSSPAITDEVVLIGGRDKRLHAIGKGDGDEKWSYLAKHRIDSSPVVAGDRVFFGSSDGRVQAVSLKTGKAVWTYEAGGGFTGSPAIADHRLVIANDDGVVYCFGEAK